MALATLSPGEVVLDLGSGGGIDVLLSVRGGSWGRAAATRAPAGNLKRADEILARIENELATAAV